MDEVPCGSMVDVFFDRAGWCTGRLIAKSREGDKARVRFSDGCYDITQQNKFRVSLSITSQALASFMNPGSHHSLSSSHHKSESKPTTITSSSSSSLSSTSPRRSKKVERPSQPQPVADSSNKTADPKKTQKESPGSSVPSPPVRRTLLRNDWRKRRQDRKDVPRKTADTTPPPSIAAQQPPIVTPKQAETVETTEGKPLTQPSPPPLPSKKDGSLQEPSPPLTSESPSSKPAPASIDTNETSQAPAPDSGLSTSSAPSNKGASTQTMAKEKDSASLRSPAKSRVKKRSASIRDLYIGAYVDVLFKGMGWFEGPVTNLSKGVATVYFKEGYFDISDANRFNLLEYSDSEDLFDEDEPKEPAKSTNQRKKESKKDAIEKPEEAKTTSEVTKKSSESKPSTQDERTDRRKPKDSEPSEEMKPSEDKPKETDRKAKSKGDEVTGDKIICASPPTSARKRRREVELAVEDALNDEPQRKLRSGKCWGEDDD